MLKIDLTEFFWKKSCFDSFVPKVARKEPKMFFIYYWKSMRGTFLIFCIKRHWLKDLKFTQVIFIRKSFVLKVFGPQGVWAQMRLFKFCEKSVYGSFLIFCMKLQQLKRFKLTRLIFLMKNLVLGFQTKRCPNWVMWVYDRSIHWIFLIFYIKL